MDEQQALTGKINRLLGAIFGTESMATCLKEQMRTADCPSCGWTGYVDTL